MVEAMNGKRRSNVGRTEPVLILLDVNLPDMNGFEVCQRIRRDPDYCRTRSCTFPHRAVLAQHQVYGLDSGADSYMVEPSSRGSDRDSESVFARAPGRRSFAALERRSTVVLLHGGARYERTA